MTEAEFMEHVKPVWAALPLHDAVLAMGVLGYVCREVVKYVEERSPGTAKKWMTILQQDFDEAGVRT